MKTSSIDLSFLDTYLDIYEQIQYLFLTNQNLPLVFEFKTINRIRKYLVDYVSILNSISNSLNYIRNFEKEGKSSASLETQILLSNAKSSEEIKKSLYEYLSALQNFKTTSTENIAESDIDALENIYTGLVYLSEINNAVEPLLSNSRKFPPSLDFSHLRNSLLDKLSIFVKQTESAKKLQSPISSVINLISSFSFYENSLDSYDVYSPVVSPNRPKDLNIYAKREAVKAVATSNPFPQTVSHTDFRATIDGNSYTIPFPSSIGQGRIYILSSVVNTINITTNKRLYLNIAGILKPKGLLLPEGVQLEDGILAIDFPAGSYTRDSIVSTINAGLTYPDNALGTTNFGSCSAFSISLDRFVISINALFPTFSVVMNPGSWNNVTGVYTNSRPSCHEEIGLLLSSDKSYTNIDYQDLRDCISYYFPITLSNDVLVIESVNSGESASITFSNSISTDIGFTDVVSINNSISLYSGQEVQNPISLGVDVGYSIVDDNGKHVITSLIPITYSSPPNKNSFNVNIYTDLVDIVKNYLFTSISLPHKEILNIWTPIINNPLPEQVNEARSKTKVYIDKIQQSINLITYTVQNSALFTSANDLLELLESKGYNKLIFYLDNADFSSFFTALETKSNLSFNQALADSLSNTKN